MKKKFREITVDGVKYGWTVYVGEDSPNTVTIWLNKKPLYESVNCGYMDITPKLIRYWIITKGEKTIEQLEKELSVFHDSEMWQAGAAVRSLRPENWKK